MKNKLTGAIFFAVLVTSTSLCNASPDSKIGVLEACTPELSADYLLACNNEILM